MGKHIPYALRGTNVQKTYDRYVGNVHHRADMGGVQPVNSNTVRVDVSALGPQVGERVPDFNLPDQNGDIWTRQSIMGPNGAMLVFVRSANW